MLWFDFRTLDMATLMANVHFVALDSSGIGLSMISLNGNRVCFPVLKISLVMITELPAGVKKISKNLHESSYSLTIHQY
jgi:hypothetical protein